MAEKRIPQWALNIAGVEESHVLTWVAGKRSREFFPPVFMLTEKEIIWADKGLFKRAQHRIPRSAVRSVSYEQGLLADKLYINVAGGDLADSGIKLSKDHRERGTRFLEILRLQLAG